MASTLGMDMVDAKDLIGVNRVVVAVVLVARNAARINNVREDMIAMQCRLGQRCGESSRFEWYSFVHERSWSPCISAVALYCRSRHWS
jgi:hypothetical protein